MGSLSQSWLSDFTFTFHFHALGKEMANSSSVFPWRIPGTREPGGLPSLGSHGVGHDWGDLAPAASINLHSALFHLSLAFLVHERFGIIYKRIPYASHFHLCSKCVILYLGKYIINSNNNQVSPLLKTFKWQAPELIISSPHKDTVGDSE